MKKLRNIFVVLLAIMACLLIPRCVFGQTVQHQGISVTMGLQHTSVITSMDQPAIMVITRSDGTTQSQVLPRSEKLQSITIHNNGPDAFVSWRIYRDTGELLASGSLKKFASNSAK